MLAGSAIVIRTTALVIRVVKLRAALPRVRKAPESMARNSESSIPVVFMAGSRAAAALGVNWTFAGHVSVGEGAAIAAGPVQRAAVEVGLAAIKRAVPGRHGHAGAPAINLQRHGLRRATAQADGAHLSERLCCATRT